jgi:hypothetical protein
MHGPFRPLLLLAVSVVLAPAQNTSTINTEIQQALVGAWVGTLEYRDFSEAATSAKRVKLPTWLTIERAGADLRFLYVYDDGPTKTVKETSVVRIDPSTPRYTILDAAGKVEDSYAIAGLAQLKSGRGSLTLTGSGTENGAAVEVRTTLRIGRNILEITRETAAPGQPFTFRHAYTMVRASRTD